MKLSLMVFCSLFCFKSYSNGMLLSCSFGVHNPSYYLVPSQNPLENRIEAELVEETTGFAGTSETSHGVQPLEFTLNPSDCSLKLNSPNINPEQFTMHFTNVSSATDKYFINVSGTAFDEMLPFAKEGQCNIENDEFREKINKICQLRSSLSEEISFTSFNQLDRIIDLEVGPINDAEDTDKEGIIGDEPSSTSASEALIQ